MKRLPHRAHLNHRAEFPVCFSSTRSIPWQFGQGWVGVRVIGLSDADVVVCGRCGSRDVMSSSGRAWQRRDGECSIVLVERQFEVADVAAIDLAWLRAVTDVAELRLTRWTLPGHQNGNSMRNEISTQRTVTVRVSPTSASRYVGHSGQPARTASIFKRAARPTFEVVPALTGDDAVEDREAVLESSPAPRTEQVCRRSLRIRCRDRPGQRPRRHGSCR